MDRAVAVETTLLTGRERELSALTRAYDEAREKGSSGFAFVKGPAGIGKSHVLAAFRQAMLERGAKVFEGGASRTASRAFSLFVDIVPELLAWVAETGVPARTVAELTRRTGPLCGREQALSLAPEERRLDLCDAVAELFALAGRAGPVYLLHDADAADRASLELLRYLAAAAQAPGARFGGLFAVSFRDDGDLPQALEDLVARTPALTLPLVGLDLDGIRAFLARREIAERLLDATGGLPTALEDVVRPVSGRPTDLFLRRVATLPEADRDALLALAVWAGPASADAVAATVSRFRGSAPLDMPVRLERLVRDHFLEARRIKGEACYALARESDRGSLLSSVSAVELKALHLGAGEALSGLNGDSEAVARHFLSADPNGRGAREAQRAAEALASRFAFEEAAEFFRHALDACAPSDRPALHEKLAEVLRASGDYVGAMKHLGLSRKDAAEEKLRALRAEAARLSILMGRLATAERLCRRVMGAAELPESSDAPGARAFVDHAEVLFLRGRYEEARQACERGIEVLRARGDLCVGLRNTLGKVFLTQARYDLARQAFEDNATAAKSMGMAREEARAVINQGVVAHRRGDRQAAIARYRAGLELCGSDRVLAAFALSNLGLLYDDSSEFDLAIEHLTRALTSFTRARRAKEVAHAASNLARIHCFLGELSRANELCEHAATVAGEVGDPYLVASAKLILGEIFEAQGRLADAALELEEARSGFEKIKSPQYAAESAIALARVHLARDERALCRAELSREAVEEVARTSPEIATERELVAGELSLAAGELTEANRRLSKAKELMLAHPDIEEPWRVYHLLASVRQAAGDAAGAAADATRAARLLDDVARRVPASYRAAFLKLPRRAAILAAAAEREITPGQARGLALERGGDDRKGLLVGKAPALQKVFKVLDAVARSNATVLVRGESGTGKELLADAIHKRSPRRDMPLVKVNCAAMVEELLLSELFGHEKGAFTGAVRERKGRFELAEGGTIFLDEIGDISPKCQVALLRVLQEREFERVGGQKTIKVDVRVICATNRDLEGMISAGQFRQDLYYRLKGVMLELPSLRERTEDLEDLCDHFLGKFARERNEEKKTLSPEALEVLTKYPWPGNIRELENVISSATIFATGRVVTPEAFEHIAELAGFAVQAAPEAAEVEDDEGDDDLPRAPVKLPEGGLDYFEIARQRGLSLKDLRHEIEVQCIQKALSEAKGNISEAARLLGMKRSRLSQIVNADPVLRAAAKS